MDKLSLALKRANEKRAHVLGKEPETSRQAADDLNPHHGPDQEAVIGVIGASTDDHDPGEGSPERLVDRYEILEMLGAGGLGEAFRAVDHESGQTVAIKVPFQQFVADKDTCDRFCREMDLIRALHHDNILPLLGVYRTAERCFVAMELREGQTLRAYLTTLKTLNRTLPLPEAIHIVDQLCGALFHAHQTTVHGDLKPENIWLTDAGNIKIMDFGFARLVSTKQLAQAMVTLGTACYLAPEQIQGRADIDARADQYALAVILFEMLTGIVPNSQTEPITRYRSDIPKHISVAIGRALVDRPEDRYAHIADFKDALHPAPRVAKSKKPLMMGAAAMVAVVALIGLELAIPKKVPPSVQGAGPPVIQADRAQAAQTLDAVNELLQQIDKRGLDFASNLRDTRGAADRLIEAIAHAKSDRERKVIAQQLAAIRIAVDIAQTIDRMSHQLVLDSDTLVAVRAQAQEGTILLRDGNIRQVLDLTVGAKADATRLLALLDELQPLLDQQQQAMEQVKAAGRTLEDESAANTDQMAEQAKKLRAADEVVHTLEKSRPAKTVVDAGTAAETPEKKVAAAAPSVPTQIPEPAISQASVVMVAPPPAVSQKSDAVAIPPTLDRKNCRTPEYPAAASRTGRTGDVVIRFLVNTDGTVADSAIETSSGSVILDKAAQTALSQCSFRPGTSNGAPQKAWASVRYRWQLDE